MIDFDEKYDLVCFDLDDTLVTAFTSDLLPGVAYTWDNFFMIAFTGKTAIISNQGGVGLRAWMEAERWGEPGKFPTAEEAQDRLNTVADALQMDYALCCFAYYSEKKNKWADPPNGTPLDDPRWRQDWRKPAGGMIEAAIMLAETTPDRVLMVGDRDEDKEAAAAAGVEFVHRDVFFAQG